MKNSFFAGRAMTALCVTGFLLYLTAKTASPKIIFMPFLLCSLSMTGKYTALLFNKASYVRLFNRLFAVGFFLFWFGFLAAACYSSIQNNNRSMLILSLPFWLVGLFIAKKRLP